MMSGGEQHMAVSDNYFSALGDDASLVNRAAEFSSHATPGSFAELKDEIVDSKSFKALKHKTQIILDEEMPGSRKTNKEFQRDVHSRIVEKDAVALAKSLGLNPELASAIALGHDCGHTPGGHAGEHALQANLNQTFVDLDGELTEFKHPLQAITNFRAEGIEIPKEVADAIMAHGKDEFVIKPKEYKDDAGKGTGEYYHLINNEKVNTLPNGQKIGKTDFLASSTAQSKICPEGILVQIADNTSSTLHDIIDLKTNGFLTPDHINPKSPKYLKDFCESFNKLGEKAGVNIKDIMGSQRKANKAMAKLRQSVLTDVIKNTKVAVIDGKEKLEIGFSKEMTRNLYSLRSNNYVFFSGKNKAPAIQVQEDKIKSNVSTICNHYRDNPEKLDADLRASLTMEAREAAHLYQGTSREIKAMATLRRAEQRADKFISESNFEQKLATQYTIRDDREVNQLVHDIKHEKVRAVMHYKDVSKELEKMGEFFNSKPLEAVRPIDRSILTNSALRNQLGRVNPEQIVEAFKQAVDTLRFGTPRLGGMAI